MGEYLRINFPRVEGPRGFKEGLRHGQFGVIKKNFGHDFFSSPNGLFTCRQLPMCFAGYHIQKDLMAVAVLLNSCTSERAIRVKSKGVGKSEVLSPTLPEVPKTVRPQHDTSYPLLKPYQPGNVTLHQSQSEIGASPL